MTTEIIVDQQIMFGDAEITAIKVLPLNFSSFVKIWSEVAAEVRGKRDASSNAIMQRKRIRLQAQFMAGDKRVAPDDANITQLPIKVAKQIVAALDKGEGVAGELLNDGDGVSVPVHYKLGTPVSMTVNGKKVDISELEFSAKIYGDIEDVLAADGDVPQTLELLRRTAVPVGADLSLTSLPGWAVDRLTIADGVTVMRSVLPRFLE